MGPTSGGGADQTVFTLDLSFFLDGMCVFWTLRIPEAPGWLSTLSVSYIWAFFFFFLLRPPHPPDLPQPESGVAHSLKKYLVCVSPVAGAKIKGSGARVSEGIPTKCWCAR